MAEKRAAALSLGILQAVRGAGTGLGPVVVAKLPVASRAAGLAPHLAAGLTFTAIAVFPLAESVPVCLLVVTLRWGMGSGANWVLSSSALQRLASDRFIGRLASIDDLATTAAMVGGAFVGAVVLEAGAGALTAATVGAVMGTVAWGWLSTRGVGREAAPVSVRAERA